MGSFGERLRREREMRGITLEEIAEATKIGSRSLRALEEENFDKLPGGIFNKGFVRAYCRYLGINEEQSVTDYVAAVTEAQAAGKLARAEYAAPPAEAEETSEPLLGRVPWGLVMAALVLVAAALAGQQYYAHHGWPKLRRERPVMAAGAEQQMPAPVTTVTPPASAPGLESQTAAPQAAPAPELVAKPAERVKPAERAKPAEPGPGTAAIVLNIRARDTVWISITADGKAVLSETLPPNTEKTIRAQRRVILKTGNAGAIDVSLNEKPMPPLGAASEVRTVTYGPNGVVPQ